MAQDLVQAMKDGMRRLVSGVSVVSTRGSEGTVFTMTVSSVTSVSDNPPSLLICVNQNTKIAPILVQGQSLALSILSQDQMDVSIRCSSGEQSEDRLKVGSWCLAESCPPYLLNAEAVFECVADRIIPYGTHNIVVAKILKVDVSQKSTDPLVYANGGYQKIC